MSEQDTRRQLIDPKLKAVGWEVAESSQIITERYFTNGRLTQSGRQAKSRYDYVLIYKNVKLAVVEAKKSGMSYGDAVGQVKDYNEQLKLPFAYATDGNEIRQMHYVGDACHEKDVDAFPSPEEMYKQAFPENSEVEDALGQIPFNKSGGKEPRYYQELAVNKAISALGRGKEKILLTLATGTGKTYIAFQIVWKLMQAKWSSSGLGQRTPRILFLADRNVLTEQAQGSFGQFPDNMLQKIKPGADKVPTNGNIFFGIFQALMTSDPKLYEQYPKDFFDLVIVDECHRGGAAEGSNWQGILNYFDAAKLGLTATPRRDENADSYQYFGDPVYEYSLKEGIEDGFLSPFKTHVFETTMDSYTYSGDDEVLMGEPELGKRYTSGEFNRKIEIREREKKRVQLFLKHMNPDDKTIIFCATVRHAQLITDIINEEVEDRPANYCVRVTSADGVVGDNHLRTFQDNDKKLPTILTTSRKLSTGVDALNVRNIVLLRPVKSMIEFKQIVGRGTRIYDGKFFFTIYDFEGASEHYSDPEWDGPPLEKEGGGRGAPAPTPTPPTEGDDDDDDTGKPKIVKIKLSDGHERDIAYTERVLYNAHEKPVTLEEFIETLFDESIPDLFENEQKLQQIWSLPETRAQLLLKLQEVGYGQDQLKSVQALVGAKECDIYDVLRYISFRKNMLKRSDRMLSSRELYYPSIDQPHQDFIDFVGHQYINRGVWELSQENLPKLIELRYETIADGINNLGEISLIKDVYDGFQKSLYEAEVA
jgi:type I restriction enzyme, R subunit